MNLGILKSSFGELYDSITGCLNHHFEVHMGRRGIFFSQIYLLGPAKVKDVLTPGKKNVGVTIYHMQTN